MFIIDKIFNLKIDTKNKNITTVTGLKQYDNNSVLNITLLQNSLALDLSDCTVRINFLREDKRVLLYMTDIVSAREGKVSIKLSPEILEKVGTVQADISVFDSNLLKITSATFNLKVEKSIFDDTYFTNKDLDLMQQEYIREKERQKAESARIENELGRMTKEGQRNSNENTRVSNEEARKKAENTRVDEWNNVKKDATNIKNTLDTTIDTANKSNTDLKNNIDTADKLKQELTPQNYVTNAKYNEFEKKTNTQYEDTTKKLNDFGGRNYLLNSNFYLGLKGYTNWCENGNLTVKNNICTVRVKSTDTDKYPNFGIVTEKFEVFENETYTISFKVASNGSTNILDYNFILNENQESVRVDNVSVNSNNYSLDKKKITFKAKNTGKIQILIGKVNKGLNLEGFDITEIKLEKGAIATDWTLALEDYIYLVNTQSKRIDAIEQALINKGILEAKKNLSI